VGAVILAAVPWQILQSVKQGQLALGGASVGGENLFKGNALAFEQLSPYIDHDEGDPHIPELRLPDQPTPFDEDDPRTNAWLGQRAWADIRADYGRFIRRSFMKAMIYLSPLQTPFGHATVEAKDGRLVMKDYEGDFVSAYASWLGFGVQMAFFVVLFAVPLGLLGMLRTLALPGRLRPLAVASLGLVLANLATHAVTIAETRFRLYIDLLLLIWAAVALECLFTGAAAPAPSSADPPPSR
jgi:hypothetical protein